MKKTELQKRESKARRRLWFKQHKKLLIIISIIVVLLIASLVTFLFLTQKHEEATPAPEPEKIIEAKKYYSPLTGNLVADEAATKMAVTGMMIENSPDARPQSGLKNSGVVFEAIAEGGITRFLVLYQQEKPTLIGPVRSLRLYDIDWLDAFDAGIGHVGGSSNALAEIRNGTHRDLDQFFNSGSYWRASDRYAPHNVYTNFEKIDALNQSKGYTTSNFTGFSRTDGATSETLTATSININVSSALYNSSYVYDAVHNFYVRSQGGEPHIDREDGQITPSVVIALHVDETTVLEDGYRESINTIGSGKATIFQNGIVIEGVWNKTAKTSQITFTDANGNDIPLVRGQTWLTAVPNGKGSVTWG